MNHVLDGLGCLHDECKVIVTPRSRLNGYDVLQSRPVLAGKYLPRLTLPPPQMSLALQGLFLIHVALACRSTRV